MGKSQFLLLNPSVVRALKEAVAMIGGQEVRISIRARRNDSLYTKAGYMTDALLSSKKTLDAHGWSIHDDTPRYYKDPCGGRVQLLCFLRQILLIALGFERQNADSEKGQGSLDPSLRV
jgi:hypothetical protein